MERVASIQYPEPVQVVVLWLAINVALEGSQDHRFVGEIEEHHHLVQHAGFLEGFAAGSDEQTPCGERVERLGILGDWARPYRTMDFANEAGEIRAFKRVIERGFVYRGLKPVYWCFDCGSSLAEFEIEYADKKSQTLDVAFKANDPARLAAAFGLPALTQDAFAVIWTTTAWTIPANQALNLNPEIVYALVDTPRGKLILAEVLVDGLIMTGLYRRLRKTEEPTHWLLGAVRRTWVPALAVAILFSLAGHLLQQAVPEARSIGPALEARDRCITELLYGCGLRIGELVGLDVRAGPGAKGWIDMHDGEAHVLGKGAKRRSKKMKAVEAPVESSPTIDWGALVPRVIGGEVGTLSPVVPSLAAAGEVETATRDAKREGLEALMDTGTRDRIFPTDIGLEPKVVINQGGEPHLYRNDTPMVTAQLAAAYPGRDLHGQRDREHPCAVAKAHQEPQALSRAKAQQRSRSGRR